jgi:hypothetical protein
MLNEIEEGVKNRIGDKMSASAAKIDVQRGVEGIPHQAIYVSVEEGDFARVTSTTYSVTVKGFVDIVFSNLQSEGERRKGIAAILEGVYQCLLLETLNLNITPIIPTRFRNVTTQEQKDSGLIVFTLEFTTKYNITKLDETAIDDLLTVGLNYYLQDPVNDGVVDAVDTVTWDAVVLAESGIDVLVESGKTITVE